MHELISSLLLSSSITVTLATIGSLVVTSGDALNVTWKSLSGSNAILSSMIGILAQAWLPEAGITTSTLVAVKSAPSESRSTRG